MTLDLAVTDGWLRMSEESWLTPSRDMSSVRSEEHTSELQSQSNLVCRLLLERNRSVRGLAQLGNESLFGSSVDDKSVSDLVVTLGEDQVKHVVEKLEGLRLELLKLRSMLLSEENSTPEELEEISRAREEIRKGESVDLKALLEEFGE